MSEVKRVIRCKPGSFVMPHTPSFLPYPLRKHKYCCLFLLLFNLRAGNWWLPGGWEHLTPFGSWCGMSLCQGLTLCVKEQISQKMRETLMYSIKHGLYHSSFSFVALWSKPYQIVIRNLSEAYVAAHLLIRFMRRTLNFSGNCLRFEVWLRLSLWNDIKYDNFLYSVVFFKSPDSNVLLSRFTFLMVHRISSSYKSFWIHQYRQIILLDMETGFVCFRHFTSVSYAKGMLSLVKIRK